MSSFLQRKLVGAGVAAAAVALAVGLWNSPRAKADDLKTGGLGDETVRVLQGFQIAPVQLNLRGKDPSLVGLGSYLVNASGDCNGCHTNSPETQFLPNGNPFFGRPKKVNPATYLGGGSDFGPLIPGSANIVSRNLTPDKTGRPEGGHTFEEFRQIIRTGVDMDRVHPTCSGAPNPNCIPPPFDGSLLQIMPWPSFQDMSDHDLRAIYEYLSAIPCVEGGPGEPPNRCNNPPFGFIDTPKENDSVTSGSWAFGWALDDSGVAGVAASLDSGPAIPALIGQPFPGVKAAYPSFPNSDRAGFGFPIPPGPVGPHVLTVTITGNDGGKTALKRQIKIR